MKKILLSKRATPHLLMLPIIIFIMVFMFYPMLNVIKMSFEQNILLEPWDKHFIGLQNYINIFTKDTVFRKSIGITAIWVIVCTAVQAVFGLWLALLLNRKMKVMGIFKTMTLLPWALAGVMVGIIWNLMLAQSYGVINDLLLKMHLIATRISWSSTSSLSLLSVCLANIWRGIPFFTISFLGALSSIPKDMYESAYLDGANRRIVLFQITIPLIKDTIVLTTLLRAIWTFNAVDLLYSMTYGGPNNSTMTIAMYVMKLFKEDYNYGYASALSVIMAGILLIAATIYMRLAKMGKGK